MLSCKTEGKLYVGGTSLHKEQAIGNEAHSHLFFLKKKTKKIQDTLLPCYYFQILSICTHWSNELVYLLTTQDINIFTFQSLGKVQTIWVPSQVIVLIFPNTKK
jgi:hypothetical protein